MARTTLISVKSIDSVTYETAKQAIVGNSHVNTVQANVDDATQTDLSLEYTLKSEAVVMVVEEELANVKKAMNKANSTNDKKTVTVTVKEIIGRREAGFTPYTLELNIEDIIYAIEDGTESAATISAVTFTGSGLDDATSGGTYTGDSVKEYYVEIDATGTPDTFQWSNDGGVTFEATGVSITGAAQVLEEGVEITFAATTGHTANDVWEFTATPGIGADTVVRHYDVTKSELVDYVVDETITALKTACNG
jgi:hypothetical protein